MRRRGIVSIAVLIVALAAALPSTAGASEDVARVAAWFEKHSLPIPTWSRFIVCHGYGCTYRTAVALRPQDRITLAGMLKASTPEAERRGIAKAVQWFDRRVGPQTGTTRARAKAGGIAGDPSQFDCVDRATNTTGLLLVLSQWKLLKHHRLDAPVSRLSVILLGAPHSTAVVTEIKSGRSWSIDPWTHNWGELPDVTPLDEWLAVYR